MHEFSHNAAIASCTQFLLLISMWHTEINFLHCKVICLKKTVHTFMFLSTSTDSSVKKGVNFSFCVVPSNIQRMVLIAWIPFCGKECVPGVEDFGKLNWS